MNNLLVNLDPNNTLHTTEPTSQPTFAGTVPPTLSPTHAPTADIPGSYAYLSTYENSVCDGVSPHITAFQTERCYKLDNLNYYIQFQCGFINGGPPLYNRSGNLVFQEADAYYAQVGLYSDSNCELDLVTQNVNYGCSTTLTPNGYLSSQALCSNSSTYGTNFPLSSTTTYNVLETFLSDSPSTCKNCPLTGCPELLYLSAYQTNHCFNSVLFGYSLEAIFGRTIDGSFKFTSSVIRKSQKLLMDIYIGR